MLSYLVLLLEVPSWTLSRFDLFSRLILLRPLLRLSVFICPVLLMFFAALGTLVLFSFICELLECEIILMLFEILSLKFWSEEFLSEFCLILKIVTCEICLSFWGVWKLPGRRIISMFFLSAEMLSIKLWSEKNLSLSWFVFSMVALKLLPLWSSITCFVFWYALSLFKWQLLLSRVLLIILVIVCVLLPSILSPPSKKTETFRPVFIFNLKIVPFSATLFIVFIIGVMSLALEMLNVDATDAVLLLVLLVITLLLLVL